MASLWKETLEPYVKVTESVRSSSITYDAGIDLVIGAVVISDTGPSVPTYISSQKEFLEYFSSSDLTEDYVSSLNKYYTGEDTELAAQMWLNAYRLAGSTHMLVCRASRLGGATFIKGIDAASQGSGSSLSDYIVKNDVILKRTSDLFIEKTDDQFAISLTNTGVIGNLFMNSINELDKEDSEPVYDYYIDNLYDLVEKLNETSRFYCPDYHFFVKVDNNQNVVDADGKTFKNSDGNNYTVDAGFTWEEYNEAIHDASDITLAVLSEVYLGSGFLEETAMVEGFAYGESSSGETVLTGLDEDLEVVTSIYGLNVFTGSDNIADDEYIDDGLILENVVKIDPEDLNESSAYAGFTEPEYYVKNKYNSNSDLKVYIRRFNHNAVQSISEVDDSTYDSPTSPYIVLKSVLDRYTKPETKNIGKKVTITKAKFDALSATEQAKYTENLDGTYSKTEALADKTGADITAKVSTQESPDRRKYYDFYEISVKDPGVSEGWTKFNVGNISGRGDIQPHEINSMLSMLSFNLPEDLDDWDEVFGLNYYGYAPDDYEQINTNLWQKRDGSDYYWNQMYFNAQIDDESALLRASDSVIMKAFDYIEDDERYIVEGLTDLGCTSTLVQNYIANIAINSNYFYPVSTVNSTNYLTIANKSKKITGDSRKLYMLSPWDYDDGTTGFMFYASPSVLYWETVSRNRRNNEEFRGTFGTEGGVVSIVNLAKEFTKTERQLLLTKKVNTIFHDLYRDSIYINDNKTKQSAENIMSEECNARLQIRISKYMPVILKRFIGRQNNMKTALEAEGVVDYWFKKHILTLGYTISDYKIQIADVTDYATNTMTVKIQVKFYNSIKYIEVYNEALSLDIEFE